MGAVVAVLLLSQAVDRPNLILIGVQLDVDVIPTRIA